MSKRSHLEPCNKAEVRAAIHALVECGFERLAEVQEEILWFAEAAHVPVIWATQAAPAPQKAGGPAA